MSMKTRGGCGKLEDKAGMSGAAVALTFRSAGLRNRQDADRATRDRRYRWQPVEWRAALQNLKERSGNVYENKGSVFGS
jgi:hypothetical protein